MIDKSLVKRRFQRSLKTYDDYAFAQKKTAEKLINLLPEKNFSSVLEIGCATGILTKEIKKNIIFNEFTANDIVEESKKYIDKIITPNTFLSGDIEEIKLNKKYDLIISNACLQWCDNIENVISKLFEALTPNGILAFSVFGDENLKEIKTVFKIKPLQYSIQPLYNSLAKFQDCTVEEEILTFYFNNPIDVLKHLKFTGVNALNNVKLTKTKLQNYCSEYQKLYNNGSKVTLTYNPVYIIIY